MGLLTPKKGAAPPTGKVKPSRADRLMAATQELATDQLPDAHTMTAIEGDAARGRLEPPDVPQPGGPQPGGPPGDLARTNTGEAGQTEKPSSFVSSEMVRQVPVDAVRPSPFQPKGRPSGLAVDAVRRAVAEAGSLAALVAPEGALLFGRLSPEAARLAELAADVAEHGISVPIEVRTTDDGALECLSGHRRLAAARLAGQRTVPALERGAISNAAAAATVLRGNLHRENFTTWQEAVLVTEVQERRRHDGFTDNVRTLGTVMGWSHGKVNMLLRIRRALAPGVLEQAAAQAGVPVGQVEEQLARVAYRDLERLIAEPDAARRADGVNRVLGFTTAAPKVAGDRLVCTHRPKRGGGFLLEVNAPVEAMSPSDASYLRELLEVQLTRVNARLAALGSPTA